MALALHRRDHGVCWRCGLYIHLTYPWTSRYALTIGHRIPLAQGGSNEPDNLAPEHRGCNLSGRPMQPRALIVTPR
jgi:5-methylcytosine-specific restriction endonuclease McrA